MNLRQPLKQAAMVAGTALLVLAIGTGISLIGIELTGGLIQWRQWIADHTGAFRIWRIGLYAVTLAYWIRLRRAHPLPPARHQRLLRLECTVVALLVLIELQTPGGEP
jgi:hypothetical protein